MVSVSVCIVRMHHSALYIGTQAHALSPLFDSVLCRVGVFTHIFISTVS